MVARKGNNPSIDSFNCGGQGHGATDCSAPRDPLGFKGRFDEFQKAV
jgi:hypothetical protein